MRITTQQIFDNLLLGISQNQQAQADGAAQVSSGHKFTRPSEDGLGFKKSVDIRHVQAGIKASLAGLATAKTRLGASSNALSQMLPLLQRAQVLAVQQANAALSATERQAAAAEVTTLQDQLLALANQKFEGESLFAGTATNATPITFDGSGNAVYNGNAQDRVAAITSTQTVISNVRGDHTAFTQAFASVKALKDALSANNTAGIQTSLGQLNAAGDAMTELTAETGGRLSAVSLREQVFQDLQVQTEQRRGQIEDADITAVAVRLARSQAALQAAFSVMARIGNLSLVQFLR